MLEALREGQVSRVMVAKGIQSAAHKELLGAARRAGALFEEVPRIQLDQALRTTNHQGVAAELPEIPVAELPDAYRLAQRREERLLLVFLDQLTDPRNVGAIIRSAEALGAHGVIMEERRSAPLSAVVVKAAAGATSLIPIIIVTNLVRTIEEVKERGVWVYGAAPPADGAQVMTPDQVDWDRDAAIVIGSEGTGMRRLVRERCDDLVSLPMRGRIGSLNASVAAGVLLYCVQQGRTKPRPTKSNQRHNDTQGAG